MIDTIKKEILQFVSLSDYRKGEEYFEEYIEYLNGNEFGTNKLHKFLVESERTMEKYKVEIEIQNYCIKYASCTCARFNQSHSCKHIAASLILYSDVLLSISENSNSEFNSQKLLETLKEKNQDSKVKKEEVFLIPYFSYKESKYRPSITLIVKIGQNKMYSFLGKFSSFEHAYENERPFPFGTNFIYDPIKHYFSEKSLRLLDILALYKIQYGVTGNSMYLSQKLIKKIFSLFSEGLLSNETNKFIPIKNEFPYEMEFSKNEEMYSLSVIKNDNNLLILTDDYEYVMRENTIFHLDKAQQTFLHQFVKYKMNKVVFPEQQFNEFQKNVIHVVKNKIILDESTKDFIIDDTPEVLLFFDLNEMDIFCIPKFKYREQQISIFEEKIGLIRDNEFEEDVCNELIDFGFNKTSSNFLLDDLDLACDFMEEGLDKLSEKYATFTSEKLKNTSIIKQNNITSTFHIGKDNILHYEFNLGAISNNEIDQVLLSLKNKKKYYRLKSGDILSLENNELQQLQSLSEDLDLSLNNLENGGTIPKFRALYLDSLQEKKYNIIKTDSLFQDFVKNFKEFQKTDVKLSKKEQNILRDYQENGVKWLYSISKCGFGGILADEMGLGKSLQTIYFFKKILEEDNNQKLLIVCPTSLVYNWENEFLKFAPALKYQVFSGNKTERLKKLDAYQGNIFITSYGLLREDIEFYQKLNFKVFVIDEAQNIKNPSTGLTKAVKSMNAGTKLALTGTPIENSIVELWSIFDFIMPGFLSSLMKFQKKYNIKDFGEDTNSLLTRLKEQIKPFILRRKKCDVIRDLPDKIENNIFIDLNEEQKKIYAAEIKYVNEQMTQMVANGGFSKNKMLILSLLTRLRQICIDPAIIFDQYKSGSSKIENLIKIIKEVVENKHKVLLFTSFKTALNIVKKALDEEDISSYTIAGDVSSKNRQMLVDAFNKDNTSVFLIMLKSGGTGLNLTSADIVIHLDMWWNPQAENQATDRTHRIGQTKNVEVIKLICKGTIEEKILDLQKKKKILSDKILETELDNSSHLQQLSETDIRSLLAFENKE